MPLGNDQQYDVSWAEQDKIRRRLELKHRVKLEGIIKKYDPFLQMKGIIFNDPAVDRYMDLRKKGRMPGAPFGAKLYFTLVGMTIIPIFLLRELFTWERRDYLEKCASGDYPLEKREGKSMGC